jgi:Xaa-Pro dipeptidase
VKPGNPLSAIDKAARDVITAAGMGKYFYTRTGHGLGLEVHEPPSVWSGNHLPLKTGLVFTIEPGIYLQSEFGVRIEDTIAVTDQGADRLTASDRELRVL